MPRNYPLTGVVMMPYVSPNSAEYVASYAKCLYNNYVRNLDTLNYPTTMFYDLSNRVFNTEIRRGRNYELGRAESGEARIRLDNTDGLLTATNTASPLYGYIKPYVPIYINAMHNGASTVSTGNLINDLNVADFNWDERYLISAFGNYAEPISVTSNDSNFETSDTNNWQVYSTLSSPYLTRQSTYKWQGTYAGARTNSSANDEWVLLDVPVVAGQTYTASGYTTRSASTLTFNVWDGVWYNGKTATASTSMSTSSTTFTRHSLTWTATSNRATIGYKVPTTQTLRLDGIQVEVGSSATTYTTTGPKVYPLFSGFIERYPQDWLAPNRVESDLVAVDTLASMSQVNMDNLYFANTLSLNPMFYYPLNSETDATSTSNYSAFNQASLDVTSSNQDHSSSGSLGTLSFGNQDAQVAIPGANTTGCQFVDGVQTTKFLQLTNTNLSDLSFNSSYSTTVNRSFELWFTPSVASGSALFSIVANDGTVIAGASMSAGTLTFSVSGATGSITTSQAGFTAGTWYFMSASVVYNTSTNAVTIELNTPNGTTTNSGTQNLKATVASIEVGRNCTNIMAHFAIYNTDVTSFYASRYAIGGTAYSGIELNTQFASLFTSAGFNYPILSTETSVSFGQAMNWIDGASLFDNAQKIADSEASTWFVAGSGEVVFRNRTYRQSQFVPDYAFSDTGSDIPYQASDLVANYDPTFVLNDITITRNAGVVSNAFDDASVLSYYPRTYDRVIYNTSDLEAIDCAYYLLDRYKEPAVRIESITLTPARNPNVWTTALNIEIDDLVSVVKEQNVDASSVTISGNYFIEQINHIIDGQTGDWTTRLMLSPQLRQYNELGAFDTTLNTNSAVGATSLTLVRGSYSLNDLMSGQMMTIDRADATKREDFVVAGSVTQTSSTLVVPVLPIASSGYYSTESANPDDTQITAETTGMPTPGVALIGMEIVSYNVPVVGVMNITRGQYGTIPSQISVNEPIYVLGASMVSAHTAGCAVNEYLPDTNTDGVFYYDNIDTTVLTVTGAGTTTTPASGLGYTMLPMAKLPDFNNVPASDITVGQYSVATPTGGSAQDCAIASVTDSSATGLWNAYLYPIGATRLLSADMTNSQLTVTCTTTFPLATRAILIDNEWMEVISGTGTATVGVVRGTPDSTVWGMANVAEHYNLNQTKTIYLVTATTGLSGSYSSGGTITMTSASVATPIRLAY